MKNALCTMPPWVEISCKTCLIFLIYLGKICTSVGTLIIGVYLVYLITGQALGESSTIQKVLASLLLVCRWTLNLGS